MQQPPDITDLNSVAVPLTPSVVETPSAALSEPESSRSRLMRRFFEHRPLMQLPLRFNDRQAANRIAALLYGMNSFLGTTVPKVFRSGDLSPSRCINDLMTQLTDRGAKFRRLYFVGSGGRSGLGKAWKLHGLNSIQDSSLKELLRAQILGHIDTYADVDYQIEVDADGPTLLALARHLADRRDWPTGNKVKVDYDRKSTDPISFSCAFPGGIDIMIYRARTELYVTKGGSLRIDLTGSDLPNGIVALDCPEPVDCWRGQVLNLAERGESAGKTTFRQAVRILGHITHQSYVTSTPLEAELAATLIAEAACYASRLDDLITKLVARHDPADGVAPFYRLNCARWIRDYGKEVALFQRLVPKGTEQKGALFFLECCRLLDKHPEAVLAFLELIALWCLIEGIRRPCSARLVSHEREYFLNLRCYGAYGHRDLRLRLHPDETVKVLKRKDTPWNELRPLIHLFWSQIRTQELAAQYPEKVATHVAPAVVASIKKLLVYGGTVAPSARLSDADLPLKLILASNPPDKELQWLAQALLDKRIESHQYRATLVWQIIDMLTAPHQAKMRAVIATNARRQDCPPAEGYAERFARHWQEGKPNAELLEAVAPVADLDWQAMVGLSEPNRTVALFTALEKQQVPAAEVAALLRLLPEPDRLPVTLVARLYTVWETKEFLHWVEKCHFYLDEALRAPLTDILLAAVNRKEALPLPASVCCQLLRGCSPGELLSAVEALLTAGASSEEIWTVLESRQLSDANALRRLESHALMRGQPWLRPTSTAQEMADFAAWNELLTSDRPGDELLTFYKAHLKGKTPPGGEKHFAIALMRRRRDPELLKRIWPRDISGEIAWDELCRSAGDNPEKLLLELGLKNHLMVYTCGLLAFRPLGDEYYTGWCRVTCAFLRMDNQKPQDLARFLTSPDTIACLKLRPQLMWKVIDALPDERFIPTARQVYDQQGTGDADIAYKLISKALVNDPTGAHASEFFHKLHSDDYQRGKYPALLNDLATRLLAQPQGDLKAIAAVWRFTQKVQPSGALPSPERLATLIRLKAAPLVAKLIIAATVEERRGLPAQLFLSLMAALPEDDLSERCHLLHACETVSETLSPLFERTLQCKELLPTQVSDLLRAGRRCGMDAQTVASIALRRIGGFRRAEWDAVAEIVPCLMELILKLPTDDGLALWQMVWRRGKQVLSEANFNAALHLCDQEEVLSRILASTSKKLTSRFLEELELDRRWQRIPSDLRTRCLVPYLIEQAGADSDLARRLFWQMFLADPTLPIVWETQLDLLVPPGQLSGPIQAGLSLLVSQEVERCRSNRELGLQVDSVFEAVVPVIKNANVARSLLECLKGYSDLAWLKPTVAWTLCQAPGVVEEVANLRHKLKQDEEQLIWMAFLHAHLLCGKAPKVNFQESLAAIYEGAWCLISSNEDHAAGVWALMKPAIEYAVDYPANVDWATAPDKLVLPAGLGNDDKLNFEIARGLDFLLPHCGSEETYARVASAILRAADKCKNPQYFKASPEGRFVLFKAQLYLGQRESTAPAVDHDNTTTVVSQLLTATMKHRSESGCWSRMARIMRDATRWSLIHRPDLLKVNYRVFAETVIQHVPHFESKVAVVECMTSLFAFPTHSEDPCMFGLTKFHQLYSDLLLYTIDVMTKCRPDLATLFITDVYGSVAVPVSFTRCQDRVVEKLIEFLRTVELTGDITAGMHRILLWTPSPRVTDWIELLKQRGINTALDEAYKIRDLCNRIPKGLLNFEEAQRALDDASVQSYLEVWNLVWCYCTPAGMQINWNCTDGDSALAWLNLTCKALQIAWQARNNFKWDDPVLAHHLRLQTDDLLRLISERVASGRGNRAAYLMTTQPLVQYAIDATPHGVSPATLVLWFRLAETFDDSLVVIKTCFRLAQQERSAQTKAVITQLVLKGLTVSLLAHKSDQRRLGIGPILIVPILRDVFLRGILDANIPEAERAEWLQEFLAILTTDGLDVQWLEGEQMPQGLSPRVQALVEQLFAKYGGRAP